MGHGKHFHNPQRQRMPNCNLVSVKAPFSTHSDFSSCLCDSPKIPTFLTAGSSHLQVVGGADGISEILCFFTLMNASVE